MESSEATVNSAVNCIVEQSSPKDFVSSLVEDLVGPTQVFMEEDEDLYDEICDDRDDEESMRELLAAKKDRKSADNHSNSQIPVSAKTLDAEKLWESLSSQPTADLVKIIGEKLLQSPAIIPQVLVLLVAEGSFGQQQDGDSVPSSATRKVEWKKPAHLPRATDSGHNVSVQGPAVTLHRLGKQRRPSVASPGSESGGGGGGVVQAASPPSPLSLSGNSPLPASGEQQPKRDAGEFLQRVLDDPTGDEAIHFQAFLESIFASENFLFLKELRLYKASGNKERKAKKIYEQFFESNSACLNVSHAASAPVMMRFGPFVPTIFKLAEESINKNMTCDAIPRFFLSDYYRRMSSPATPGSPRKSVKWPATKKRSESVSAEGETHVEPEDSVGRPLSSDCNAPLARSSSRTLLPGAAASFMNLVSPKQSRDPVKKE